MMKLIEVLSVREKRLGAAALLLVLFLALVTAIEYWISFEFVWQVMAALGFATAGWLCSALAWKWFPDDYEE